jgi:serpin B
MRGSFLLLLVVVVVMSQSQEQEASTPSSPVTTLGLRLAAELEQRTVANGGRRPNFVISPLSAHAALSMLAQGAQAATLAELEQMIGLPAGNSSRLHRQLSTELTRTAGSLELGIANLLALATGFTPNPTYRQLLETNFQTRVEQLDFARRPAQSVQQINRFVSEATNGQIDRLLSPTAVGPTTRLMLINALYFKALWAERFDPRRTTGGIFTTATGKRVRTRFLTRTLSAWLRQDPVRQITMLELPYSDNSTSMLVILPYRNTSGGILDRLSPSVPGGEGFQFDRRVGGATWTRVLVQLPRFKIRHRTDLKAVLPTLGIRDVFDPERADLRGIADVPPRLYVDLALQEAVVEVTEEGTRAAAATAIGVIFRTAFIPRPLPFLFRADRPFAFVIFNRRLGVPLFLGKVGDPTGVA